MSPLAKKFISICHSLTRAQRIALGSLTMVTLAIIFIQMENDSSREKLFSTDVKLSETMDGVEADSDEILDDDVPIEADLPPDELDKIDNLDPRTQQYTIATGDTLSNILTQYAIDMSDITVLAQQHPALRNLNIGQQLSWTIGLNGELQTLTWIVSRRETHIFTRSGVNFVEKIELKQGEWKNHTVAGKLNGSFVRSAKAVGMSAAEINAVIQALQWQLDFRKLHPGDQFVALFSREQLDGHSERSQLLGVRLRSNRDDYYAILAADGKYYDKNGHGLAQGFLRFPTLKQFRISSHFNLRRVNPVTKKVAPHLGVDFAMPVGTPILAVGDGEVIVVKKSGNAGNYITIRHGRQYLTRYMHLQKAFVQPGQKVKRGERIALSGNTGRSTGPHLHFEFWVNNKAVNPLTVKLPQANSLTGNDLKEYLVQSKEIYPQLNFD